MGVNGSFCLPSSLDRGKKPILVFLCKSLGRKVPFSINFSSLSLEDLETDLDRAEKDALNSKFLKLVSMQNASFLLHPFAKKGTDLGIDNINSIGSGKFSLLTLL